MTPVCNDVGMEMPPTFTVELDLAQYLWIVPDHILGDPPRQEWLDEIDKMIPIVNEFVGEIDEEIVEQRETVAEFVRRYEALPAPPPDIDPAAGEERDGEYRLIFDGKDALQSLFAMMTLAVEMKFDEIADGEEDDEDD